MTVSAGAPGEPRRVEPSHGRCRRAVRVREPSRARQLRARALTRMYGSPRRLPRNLSRRLSSRRRYADAHHHPALHARSMATSERSRLVPPGAGPPLRSPVEAERLRKGGRSSSRARARCCQVDWRPLRPAQRCTSPSKIARRSNCSRWRCTPASRRRWPCGTRHERDWEGGGDGDAARPLTRAISRARPARSVGSGKTCCGSSRIHAFARRRSSPSGANGTSRFK